MQALQQHAPVASPEPPEAQDEPPKPAPAPPLQPPEPDAPRDETQPEPPQLTQEEQQRWLARVQDDPSRALRAAARGEAAGPRHGSGPAW